MASDAAYYHQINRLNQQSFSHKGAFEFQVPDEELHDSDFFKNTFTGNKNILTINGKSILKKIKPSPKSTTILVKDFIQKEIIDPTNLAQVREKFKIDLNEIRERIKTEVEESADEQFNSYLSKKNLDSVKDKIKTLFSSKAFTSFFTSFTTYSDEVLKGIFAASARDLPIQTCNLVIPKNKEDAVQIVATVKQTFTKFKDEDLPSPIKLKAEVTYTIPGDNGQVSAMAKIKLKS